MNILCIEDQENKYHHISEVLNKYNINLIWKRNCQTGLMELLMNKYEYLLLDMSMPICENEYGKDNFDSYAGLWVLLEIKRKKYDIKVIIITGFSDFERGEKVITLRELENEIIEKYAKNYIGHVKYDSTSVEWQDGLLKLLGLE